MKIKISAQRPLLSNYKLLIKNLSKIDKNRFYSNYGPLYYTVKKKIENHFKLKKFSITFSSSGHSAIQACCNLIASKNKKKYVIIPSFCFASDPQAVIQSGLKPIFVDINPDSLEMNYHEAKKILNRYKKDCAAILICSPFGYPLEIKKIVKFFSNFNIPIIYDAADAIINTNEIIEKSNLFYTFSFHPTKNLPSNESGMIISAKSNEDKLSAILNFGINLKDRKINFLGFNGKFSEYDAAILDANFSNLKKRRLRIKDINRYLIYKIKNKNLINQNNFGINWYSLKVVLYHKRKSYFKLKKFFEKNRIEIFKPWNEKIISNYSIFRKYKKTSLKFAKFIDNKIFAIPIHYDMTKSKLDYIIKIVNKI